MPKGKWPNRSWIVLLAGVVLIRLSILEPQWVEYYYSTGLYFYTSRFMRFMTAWLPFSVGDLIYIAAGLWLIRGLIAGYQAIKNKEANGDWVRKKAAILVQVFLSIYLIFNLLWGINYNRQGVAGQLGLKLEDTSAIELSRLTSILLQNTNQLRPADPAIGFNRSAELAKSAYRRVGARHEFLESSPFSIKPSIFGVIGNYMGYSGYYNPFSGEGQVNTKVPGFLIPFVTCHEMAHQAGYAKENEANFVGFLAARESKDSALLYSTYLNMFLYANNELRQVDSVSAKENMKMLSPDVMGDIDQYRKWIRAYDTSLGDFIDIVYNQYLKLNEQPAGRRSYNQVVIWLMAYYRQQGEI
ncbi:MAG TPA: DUF3810 domain-containing protein [Chitinophagaceae bacterium]|nr:DUF3810 domain-containing protein [Chitinophagaceae bacterium]